MFKRLFDTARNFFTTAKSEAQARAQETSYEPRQSRGPREKRGTRCTNRVNKRRRSKVGGKS